MLKIKILHAKLRLKREEKTPQILQVMLIILISLFVFEVGKYILTPNELIIEVTHAQVASSVSPQGIESAAKEVSEYKSGDIKSPQAGEIIESTQQLIERVAKKKGFKNIEGLKKLTHCESRFTPTAFNPTNNSNDRGLYQISKRWHPEVSDEVAYNPELATAWTIDRINLGYGYEWMCWHSFNDNNYIY